jgi:hypothetical protein
MPGAFAQTPAPHLAPAASAPRPVPTPIASAQGETPHAATMPNVAAMPNVATMPHVVTAASPGSNRVMLTPPAPAQEAVAAPAAQSVFRNSTTSASARRGVRLSLPMVGGLLLLLAAVGGGLLYFEVGGLSLSASPTPAAPTTGTVHVESRPAGATVVVDGTPRGAAPLQLRLAPGAHTVEVQHGGTKRVLPLTIDAGLIVRQYVDFGAPAGATGKLEITSEPAGAEVVVDGTPRGTTPLIVADVAPGSHTIAIGSGPSTVMRVVEVTAGATASVVVSIAPTEGAAGWVALKAPFPMEMREGERLLAAAGVDRVMLPTGRHTLQLAAGEYEFTTTVNVTVIAGKTVSANVAIPNGKLSINAAPWAEVWLDGKEMGTTPLGNVSVPIGTHEIVWKHPEHGERRQLVKVPAQTPVRASMDFGK